jgi:hypothetical protein
MAGIAKKNWRLLYFRTALIFRPQPMAASNQGWTSLVVGLSSRVVRGKSQRFSRCPRTNTTYSKENKKGKRILMDYYSDSYQANDSYQTGSEEGYRPSTGGPSGPSGGDSYQRQNSPPLLTEKIVTERKQFFLDLKENNRGRVVKITEDVRGRRDTIMVPIEVLQEFHDALGRILDYERGL